ncbi:uncharacterized protein B0T23DRAFT_392881 [Neurospora hispaniola]|uniref:Uncharacterized protein n=1 Tax=Neurospora hispaniola TaxID=588809 RepID=A0AAJ0IHB5_9PEZI|nr:hypothetical protein B0T23DRAFT_392881 [Neurospora hispaniola]
MAEKTKTDDEAMEDLVQYLEKGYTTPHDWAPALSIFFKALAMKHFTPVALVEGKDLTFKSLMRLLRDLSMDRNASMFMGISITTSTLRQRFPSYYAQDVKADVFDFETNSAYTLRITEDTPTSELSYLTLNGKGPATVTVSVQRKEDATASEAKSEG